MRDELATKEGEFEKILSLAEELQKNCESYSSRISTYRTLEFSLALVTIIGFLTFFWIRASLIFEQFPTIFLAIFLLISVSYIYVCEYTVVRKCIKKRRRDSRALYEIVELLRELGEAEGKNEGWSDLDRAQYRIRLSRFAIGDDDSDFLRRNFARKSEL